MAVCGSRSADLPADAKFCSHCGESTVVPSAADDPRLAATHHLLADHFLHSSCRLAFSRMRMTSSSSNSLRLRSDSTADVTPDT